MQLDHFVNTLGKDLKRRFGGRVRKLTIDANFTCPNRDGTLGRGGCTFCNMDSFVATAQQQLSISEQLTQRKAEMKHQNIQYLAYFQAYSNTYAEINYLQNMYQQALENPDVVGLCIGTRPDCLPDAVLKMLAEYQNTGKEVWLELGLQSAKDSTLKRINRGHDFSAYQQAVLRAQNLNLKVCTHLILGLPGETMRDYQQTLTKVLACGVQGLKLHPLHIVRGSAMARSWKNHRLHVMSLDEYADAATNIIQHTPAHIIFHRVSAKSRPPVLLAPDWCGDRWSAINHIVQRLATSGAQGCHV